MNQLGRGLAAKTSAQPIFSAKSHILFSPQGWSSFHNLKFFHFCSVCPHHTKGTLTLDTSLHHPKTGRIRRSTSKLIKYLLSFPRPTLYKAALKLKIPHAINSFSFSGPESLSRRKKRLPEFSESREEWRDRLKNHKRTIVAFHEYLK